MPRVSHYRQDALDLLAKVAARVRDAMNPVWFTD